MSYEDIVRQLKLIKVWVAIGSVGFVLIGAAAMTIALGFVSLTSEMEDIYQDEDDSDGIGIFEDHAAALMESGNLEELDDLIQLREVSHPYDANVYWYRARLHAIRGEWDLALGALDETMFLAPSWTSEYVAPMESVIKRKREENQ